MRTAAVLLAVGTLAALGTVAGATYMIPAPAPVADARSPQPSVPSPSPTPEVPSPSAYPPPSGSRPTLDPITTSSPPAPAPSVATSAAPSLDPITTSSPPAPAPSVATSAAPLLDPPPAAGPFAIDLYRKGDFVSELTKDMCVPAAMQTIVNIIEPGADSSAALQKRLYSRARALSTSALVGAGAEPEGWARALTELGYGPYAVDVQPSLSKAIRSAAVALRTTGRPVGLLVWRGAHSWVVSGFTSTADPARTTDFEVTGLYIEDVWYPRISTIWGASRPPDALVPVGKMGEDYLRWKRPTHAYPDKDGKYVLVIPTETPAA